MRRQFIILMDLKRRSTGGPRGKHQRGRDREKKTWAGDSIVVAIGRNGQSRVNKSRVS